MKTIEYRTRDKSGWGMGPWHSEPDKKQWQDEETGLPCLIVRGPVGALCGYVGVPAAHPYHGKDYNDVAVDVHGGLTFADFCAEAPSREQWEKFKARGQRATAEAVKYPFGDSAEFVRDRAKELSDYDAYATWCEAAHICHRVEPGEDDKVWWFGFDCAHFGDYSPKLAVARRSHRDDGETYRDMAYVEAEVRKLAGQLQACAHVSPANGMNG